MQFSRSLGGLAVFAVLLPAATAGQDPVSFNRDIRPIMSDTCFRCHGPDKSSRMAGMRLDIRDQAVKPLKDGTVPIVPGDPDKSAIIQRIFAPNPARIMPPKFSHKVLTKAQKDTIRRWVAEGAKYEGHWAYQPVHRPAVPEGPHAAVNPTFRNAAYGANAIENPMIVNPIDAFVQARLAKEGLKPAPEASRRVLIRRVTLDLTGLPPTPEEVAAFLGDKSANAYEKVVDRLLASPRYAEMQAIHWLDAVRYADTCGFHGDNAFPAWPYRDYVLRAFRDNKPFDEFTRQQLAGDLLPDATTEDKVASAYNRMNRTSAEGGIQPKEYLAKYAADRVRTTSAVWLGSTLGCAECHDHKFDPFTSKDFYSMEAFFADIKETGLVPDRGPTAWGSVLDLPTPTQRTERDRIASELNQAREELTSRTFRLTEKEGAWEKQTLARYDSGRLAWKYQRPIEATSANGAKLAIYNNPLTSDEATHGLGDGLIVASGPDPDNETSTVRVKPGAGIWRALAIDVVPDESLPGISVARGAERLVVTEVDGDLSVDGKAVGEKLIFSEADSNLKSPSPGLPAFAAIDGDSKTGWGVDTYGERYDLVLALRFRQPIQTQAGSIVTIRVHQDSTSRRATIGRFRIALTASNYAWPDQLRNGDKKRSDAKKGEKADLILPGGGLPKDVLKALRSPEEKRTGEEREALLQYFQWASPELHPLAVEAAKLDAALGLLDAKIPQVVVTEATVPRVIRILPRANWMDETHEIVQPAVPAFLGKLETGDRRATRLDLANWIVSPENPLTARVFVNRTWRHFFGIGISKVLEDLGSQGEWPSDPALLDWLAAEFMQPTWEAESAHPWDVKHIIRTIVMSHTYRQSSQSTPEADEKDPDNRLLAHQSRFRVDAEVVHDIALSVSGLLVEKFGGPSVKPYEPAGYLAALNFPRREYSESRGDDLYRRGIYTQWQRTFLHPSLQTFDAPSREECTVNRVNSNTPLQALVLLNDPIYVEAARVFAQHILEEGGKTGEEQMDWAFQRALSRKPTPEERKILLDLEQKSLQRFLAAPADAAKLIHTGDSPAPDAVPPANLAAMTTVARTILNLHETITRN